ncbi:MAG: hypothetical protein JRI79_15760 [Deltaproteobacteria bacterium]|nr:hypothetical protein [Deltaproteobacteria bacterium]MBW1936480.1 hypothetical protein [Deltaproteobacteria bacterium]MBW1979399.1 hypothetical protein [Deltaproteobacteria bacterium]MBW2301996.1 hypothetical protein [Deltaproteobacteria bacterium]
MADTDPGTKDGPSALHEIRDAALMLSMGSDYLCEAMFLRKIGETIGSRLEDLNREIMELKKRFPGKFAEDVETDEILRRLEERAQELKDPDDKTLIKCTRGELGQELEEIVNAITVAIRNIASKVEGELPASAKIFARLGFNKGIVEAKGLASTVISVSTKVLGILLLIAVGLFGYLFITMEKEGPLQKEIDSARAYIQLQNKALQTLDREREKVSKQINAVLKDDLSRQEKIKLMELNVEVEELDKKHHEIEVRIADHEEKIKKNREKIAEIRRKPFLKRLLRR